MRRILAVKMFSSRLAVTAVTAAIAAAGLATTKAAAHSASGPAALRLDCVQPELAAEGDRVALVCGAAGAVRVAVSDDGGRTFGPLVTIAMSPHLALGRRRGPRVALSGSSLLASAVVSDRTGGGDLMLWRSTDNGRTWSTPQRINSVPDAAREGLHALGAHGTTAAVAWLDLRSGRMTLHERISSDAGRTWQEDFELYARPNGPICECCHPSVLVGPGGEVVTMFRNQVDGYRDMYLIDTKGPARRLGTGTWRLAACPMDGGGLARTRGGIETVWRREDSIFQARPGAAEQRIGKGFDPQIVGTPGGVYITWTSSDGVVLLPPGAPAPHLIAADGSFASLAWSSAGLVAAVQQGGETRVQVLEPGTPTAE